MYHSIKAYAFRLLFAILLVFIPTNFRAINSTYAKNDISVQTQSSELFYYNNLLGFTIRYPEQLSLKQWEPVANILSSVSLTKPDCTANCEEFSITVFSKSANLNLEDWIKTHTQNNYNSLFLDESIEAPIFEEKGSDNYFNLSGHGANVFSHSSLGQPVINTLVEYPEAVLSISYIDYGASALKPNYAAIVASFDSQPGISNTTYSSEILENLQQIISTFQWLGKVNLGMQEIQLQDAGYRLPYTAGNNYKVTQDWGNTYSHTGLAYYAYDFGTPNGSEIRASQSGVVSAAVGSYSACGGSSYANYGNRVVINHSDGTATLYLHLNDVSVAPGSTVNRGDLIGHSGNTGYTSCTYHLHFQRQAQGGWWTQSQAIYFDEYPGQQLYYPNYYTSQNSGGSSGTCSGPNLQSPSDGWVSSNQTITFTWGGLSGCNFSGYTFRIKDTSNMDSGGSTIQDTGVGGTSWTEPISSQWNNRDLYWGVRAANAPSGANWSVRRFRIEPGGSTNPGGSWNARYFSGSSGWWDPSSLSNATPSCTETLSSGLDKNYGSSAPCNNGMNGDDWVGEYTTTINFPSGYYVFIADHDDGFKLWRDGSTNIAERGGSGSTDYVCPAQYLSGNVNLKAMLREDGGDARIKLTWSNDTNLCVTRPSAPSLQSPSDGAFYNENQATTLSWSATGDQYYGEITGGPQPLSFGWQSGTSNNIGALWAGYTYTWRVKAQNSAGIGDWSNTRTFTVLPGTPTNLNASASSCSQINLSWNDNSGNEDGYKIYRDGNLIDALGANASSYQDTNISGSTNYNYTVYAYRGSILSPVSNTASVTTPSCGAGVPSLVSPESGTVYDEGQPISLSWTVTGTEYYGEISGGPAGTSTFGWQTATNKSIGSQWAGYVYSWRVKARNSVSTSAFSNSNTFTVRPGQPTSLTAVSPACGRVNLTWADNSGNEEGYQVYRGGSYLATVGSNVTSYQDTTAASDTSYTYTVYAYRGSIQSAVSASASVTTLVCPPSNDNMANAISISPSSLPYTNSQTSRGATLEASEPAYPVGSNLGASVWYHFTPNTTGTYSFDTSGSGYDTVLHVFERTVAGTLIPVKGNDDDPDLQGTQSKLIFTGKANTTYLFSITQYYGSTGGALTVHLVSIACPSGSLCITATSPFYSSYSFWVSVYSSSGSYVTGMRLDNYGYGAISGLPGGTYQVTISGWNMLRTIQKVPSGGYLDVTGVGLPSILVALKDLTGTQIDANAYLETSTGSYYVGRSYSDRALLVYASPADYLLVQSGVSAKYLAYNDISVQSGMQNSDMTYDVSLSPAKTFTYHLQTITSASLVLWKGNSGSSLTMNDGQTAVISFPAGKTYRMDNIVTVEDTSEYWNYEFQSRDLEMQTFREDNQVSIGGNLQFTVIPNLAPYGYGDNASFSYHVKDQFGNRLMYAWSQAKVSGLQTTDLSVQGGSSSLPPAKAVTDEVGNIHYQRTAGTDIELQTLSAISSSIQLLNPSGGQAYQETQEGWYGTIYWTIPSNAPLGTWTARVTANHLGLWQGQTVGEQTFAVRDSRPPTNDDFGSPQPISSMPYSTSEDTFGATQAPDDPAMPSCNLSPAQATVWFRYQPAQSGTLQLDTIDSDYDTVLAVWTGARGSLSLQGCNDDRITSPRDQDSELVIPVSRNITYYIMIGKYNGDYSQTAALANVKPGISMQTMGAGVAQLHISFSSSLPAAAQLTSPNNGTFLVRDVSFNWNPVAVATEYYLVVLNSGGQTVLAETLSAQDVCLATTCSYTPGKSFANGRYTWKILTRNALGSGPWSETLAFEVDAVETGVKIYIPFLFRP